MANKLSEQEIAQRLMKLRNLEHWYPKLQEKYRLLEDRNIFLESQVQELKAASALRDREIETLKLQLEELRQIVFGRSNKPKGQSGNQPPDDLPEPKQPRDSSSYRRPVPTEQEVTEEESKPLPSLSCPNCQSPLNNIHSVIRYLEDILLPVKKMVKRLTIQVGFCPKCKRQQQAIPIASHTVTLGQNIRQLVLYWTYVSRLSFQQVIDLARDLYGFKLTDGEIARILQESAGKLAVSYEQLKVRVRGSPSLHLDETTYQEQGGQNYAWVMAPSTSEEAVFLIGRGRGKGNAEELLGDFSGVRVTDCYPAYDNLKGSHQACWSHPLRYARDLANMESLNTDKHILCKEFYQQVRDIYAKVRQVVSSPFEPLKRTQAYEDLRKQLDVLAEPPSQSAPQKLLDLKQRFHNYAHEFLVCILYPDVPADNNKAERKLRHLVLKRKVSFGTRSQKGSQTFAVNASVLLSWWWNDRVNFFNNLTKALQGNLG